MSVIAILTHIEIFQISKQGQKLNTFINMSCRHSNANGYKYRKCFFNWQLIIVEYCGCKVQKKVPENQYCFIITLFQTGEVCLFCKFLLQQKGGREVTEPIHPAQATSMVNPQKSSIYHAWWWPSPRRMPKTPAWLPCTGKRWLLPFIRCHLKPSCYWSRRRQLSGSWRNSLRQARTWNLHILDKEYSYIDFSCRKILCFSRMSDDNFDMLHLNLV